MSIQQSINQAIGIGALLASQSPMAAAHKEKVVTKAAEKEAEKKLNAQAQGLQSAYNQFINKPDIHSTAATLKIANKSIDTLGQLQELNPKKYSAAYAQGLKNADIIQDVYTQEKARIAARAAETIAKNNKQETRSKMGFETRKSMILDQYANPLEVKNER